MKIGDEVSVPCRFGECGTIKESRDGRFGVEFKNLKMILWYDEAELKPIMFGEKKFSWFRMPQPE